MFEPRIPQSLLYTVGLNGEEGKNQSLSSKKEYLRRSGPVTLHVQSQYPNYTPENLFEKNNKFLQNFEASEKKNNFKICLKSLKLSSYVTITNVLRLYINCWKLKI